MWIVLPAVLGVLIYSTAALMLWPYARPIVPPWVILIAILIPPFFPVLLFYLFILACLVPRPVVTGPEIIVVDASTRGRVVSANAPRRGPHRSRI